MRVSLGLRIWLGIATVQRDEIVCNIPFDHTTQLVLKAFHHGDPEGGTITPLLEWSIERMGRDLALIRRRSYGRAVHSTMATRAHNCCKSRHQWEPLADNTAMRELAGEFGMSVGHDAVLLFPRPLDALPRL